MPRQKIEPDHDIHPLIQDRESPYVFGDAEVSDEDLRSLFEAARWAASSYNEQPFSYIVARRSDGDAYARLLSVLVEANQAWAHRAPVLAIGVVSKQFKRNGKPNKAAAHDLGAASAQLTLEATARGLRVHQMVGLDPEKARTLYGIPDGHEALTALAIGHPGDPATAPEGMAERDASPRVRRPLSEFVFADGFGTPARGVSEA